MRKSQHPQHNNSDLHISIPSNQPQNKRLSQSYTEAKRIVNNKMKGHKIQLSQYRRKQQLKTQAVNNQNMRGYMNMNELFYQQDMDGFDQPQPAFHQKSFGIQNTELNYVTRPRGTLTADPTIKDRRLKLNINQESQINRTMIVTSSGLRSSVSPKVSKRVTTYFTSNNLDNKGNDFMNLMIRSDNNNRLQPIFLEQMHTEGMIPHCRKLNSFERRMKTKKKLKSWSKQKVKINLCEDVIDLNSLSKTLQSISQHSQGPLVSSIEYKTIFRRRCPKSEDHKKQSGNYLNIY